MPSNNTGIIQRLAQAIGGIIPSPKEQSMHIKRITDNYSVSAQISPCDVTAIKAAGFTTIMCNRPDGESANQPTAAEIGKVAKEQGLSFHYVPMSPRGPGSTTFFDFGNVIRKSKGPVFAYCRSGNRCTILWKKTQS